MKNILAKISLKTLFSLFTVTTICLLFVVIFFAGKQYFLFRHCEQLVDSSQELLFQFTGIKEHINETLLSKKSLNSAELIKEIQGLDGGLKGLLEDILIPEEFKLSFISQVDLVNVTVTLRSLKNNPGSSDGEQVQIIAAQLRNLNSKLTGFHQLITRYTQTQLLGLHKALVGLLCIVVATVSIMLLVINRYITSPIIHYCRALFPRETDTISIFTLHKTIETLALQPPANMGTTNDENSREVSRLYRFSSIGHLLGGVSNELTNRSNGIINYTQAILDLGKDIDLDPDSMQLLQKLFLEEKKMSQLISHLIHFTSGSDNDISKILTLDEMFDHIISLVQATLKNDSIDLEVSMANPALTLNYHVSDLQLVVLSALQSSRTALNTKLKQSQAEDKKITLSFDDLAISDNNVAITIRDNGVAWELNKAGTKNESARPWHNMSFCSEFLQTFGGNLKISRDSEQMNVCVITIPFNNKMMGS